MNYNILNEIFMFASKEDEILYFNLDSQFSHFNTRKFVEKDFEYRVTYRNLKEAFSLVLVDADYYTTRRMSWTFNNHVNDGKYPYFSKSNNKKYGFIYDMIVNRENILKEKGLDRFNISFNDLRFNAFKNKVKERKEDCGEFVSLHLWNDTIIRGAVVSSCKEELLHFILYKGLVPDLHGDNTNTFFQGSKKIIKFSETLNRGEYYVTLSKEDLMELYEAINPEGKKKFKDYAIMQFIKYSSDYKYVVVI